ncbi:MAG: DUF4258 domain-containing protein [Kosmotogaceae bacterium]
MFCSNGQNDYLLTAHAIKRMQQRGIKVEDIKYALENGMKKHCKHAIYVFLGKRNVDKNHENLNDLHLILSEETIVTVFKNKKPQWN